MSVCTQRVVTFKRKAIHQPAGGVSYESTCGHWRVFHQGPRGRNKNGKRIRPRWYVLRRSDETGAFLFVGQLGHPHVHSDGARSYARRREALYAVDYWHQWFSRQQLNHGVIDMAKSVYNLAAAYKIDALREEFDRRMADAVADCKSRPGMKKAREVTLTIKLTPHPQDADDVLVDHEVKAKIPTRQIDRYRMQATANNGLKFQPNSPVDPDQESFDFEE